MKWFSNPPKSGDLRVRAKFLLFPKRIGVETRWLEWASWVEEYYVDWEVAFWKPRHWSNQ